MSSQDLQVDDWPPALVDVFARAITCEYATLTCAGSPVTVPTTPYVGATGTLDVSTGLTYPAKAERARRNPRVALLFADAIGAGAGDAPVILIQGNAAVRDADLQMNTDRYARESVTKLPASVEGQPKALLRRMVFYYARIWVEITPIRMRWWPDRSLSGEAQVWQADPDQRLPQSDPAPPGHQPLAWLEPPQQWHELASRALLNLPFADLTVVDQDGFPICVPVTAGALQGDQVPLWVGPGAPALPAGRACLTLHGHDDRFTTQENHTLMGALGNENGLHLHVERVLADWSLTGNKLQRSVGFLRKGRRLAPRLEGRGSTARPAGTHRAPALSCHARRRGCQSLAPLSEPKSFDSNQRSWLATFACAGRGQI